MPKRIFAVLYVSVMGLTRCYKTTVFLHLLTIMMKLTVHTKNNNIINGNNDDDDYHSNNSINNKN